MRLIFYWPDGYWCERTDLPYINDRSDDFSTLEVPYEVSEEVIEEAVQFKIRGETKREFCCNA